MHLYAVVSPEVCSSYSYWEPPEYYCCYVEVWAYSKREALSQAIKSDEFKPWVLEARGDNTTPFAGVEVNIFHCIHGVCMCGSVDDMNAEPYTDECDECWIFNNRLDAMRDVAWALGNYKLDSVYVRWTNSRS